MMNPEFKVYVGPMFATKSTRLFLDLERYKYQNKKISVFKPKMDDRYSSDEIVSHSGWRFPATQVVSGTDILANLSNSNDVSDVVAVDELFMIPGSAEALIWLYQSGFNITVASLDLSAVGKPFKEVEKILPWATHIEKCAAVCVVCGHDAYYTYKKQLTDEEASTSDWVTVGGAELYEPRCFHCHPLIDQRPSK